MKIFTTASVSLLGVVAVALLTRAVPVARAADSCQRPGACQGLSPPMPPAVPSSSAKSVLGQPLKTCSLSPRTGFRRSGSCETGPDDRGVHVVCAEVSEAFLRFTKQHGNDLSTPAPDFDFPGLRPGDRWCLCAARWQEARQAEVAPPVILEATDQAALRTLKLADLRAAELKPR